MRVNHIFWFLASMVISGSCWADGPTGSFLLSCQVVSQDSSYVNAYCHNRFGGINYTSINYTYCPQQSVDNSDGAMICDGSQGPDGSYAISCPYTNVSGSSLDAFCYNQNAALIRTHIIFTQCPGNSISNIYGVLVCD